MTYDYLHTLEIALCDRRLIGQAERPHMDIATKTVLALASLSSTRLYELSFKEEKITPIGLLVEAFLAVEEVQGTVVRDVIVLSSIGELKLGAFLGQQASLEISLANGTRTTFTGLISEAAMLGSTGRA